MQYILTSEELAKLEQTDLELREKHRDMVQDLCKRVARAEPVAYTNAGGKLVKDEVWGCVLDGTTVYCDHCPVQKQCPHPHKEYSK